MRFSQTVVPAKGAFDPDELWSSGNGRRVAGRRAPVGKGQLARAVVEPNSAQQSLPPSAANRLRLHALVAEWLLEVRVMGRSQRTIGWYPGAAGQVPGLSPSVDFTPACRILVHHTLFVVLSHGLP